MVVQEDDYLAHIGIMGMRWGRSRNPQHLVKKAETLNKKIVGIDVKSAKISRKTAINQSRLNDFQMKNLSFELTDRGMAKAKRTVKRIKSLSKKNAKLEVRSAKYKQTIYKDAAFVKRLASKTSSITAKELSTGKTIVNNAFGE